MDATVVFLYSPTVFVDFSHTLLLQSLFPQWADLCLHLQPIDYAKNHWLTMYDFDFVLIFSPLYLPNQALLALEIFFINFSAFTSRSFDSDLI